MMAEPDLLYGSPHSTKCFGMEVKMKLLVLTPSLKDRHREAIIEKAGSYDVEVCFAASEDEIPSDFSEPDIIYGFGVKTAQNCRTLKWMCVPWAGVDSLMKPGIFANDECILTNSSGAYGVSIAEHIIAVTLMMMRHLTTYHEEILKGNWGRERYHQDSIKDSRITVLGTGDIGCTFATRARAFEPAGIVGVSRSGVCERFDFDKMLKTDDLDSVLPDTDLLVMSLPGTDETVNILNRERIMSMPQGAYIVNVGRGSAIDDDALCDALESGHLGGASLDVFKTEPLPKESRLWKTKNLLITPHVAGNLTLDHTLNKNVDMFLEDMDNFFNDRPLKNKVDRSRGY